MKITWRETWEKRGEMVTEMDTKEHTHLTELPELSSWYSLGSPFEDSFSHLFCNYLSSERYWAICQTYNVKQNKTSFCHQSLSRKGDECQKPWCVWDFRLFISYSSLPQFQGCWQKTWDLWWGGTISQSNPSLGTGLLRHRSHTAAVEGSDDGCKSVTHAAGERLELGTANYL